MVSVCLPSDALSQCLPSYLGFSYPGHGVSLHGYSSKAQPPLLTLDAGKLLSATSLLHHCSHHAPARRDKKAFLSKQCKETEENNRMGKTRDLFRKISDTKGTFHAKMGSIKDRNGRDLTEAEDIKKRWQEYT